MSCRRIRTNSWIQGAESPFTARMSDIVRNTEIELVRLPVSNNVNIILLINYSYRTIPRHSAALSKPS